MTYEQVAKAADELKNRHPERKKPSVRQVYALTGGDYNAVQKHMKTWRLTQVSASQEASPSLSPTILRALSEEITQQRNAATTTQSVELEECREELEDLQREYGVQSGRMTEMVAQLQAAVSERERLVAERDHHVGEIAKLIEKVSAERGAAEDARIELAQTRLRTSGDAELVATLRADIETRRAEIETERAGRIDAERKLAAASASYEGIVARMEDHSARMKEIEGECDLLSSELEAERNRRVDAERKCDIAEQRAVAATACADDLRVREVDLRARIDQMLVPPRKSRPDKRTNAVAASNPA